MNAPVPASALKPPDDFASMAGQAHRWRGECIQHFAELEQIVEDLLRSLQRSRKGGGKVKVGQPISPAFGHLRELTGSKGPFASKGTAISETLAELAPWFEWRAHLTHGVLTVWRGKGDHWLITLAHRSMNEERVRTHAILWKEACAMRDHVSKRVATLRENARSLANSVANAT